MEPEQQLSLRPTAVAEGDGDGGGNGGDDGLRAPRLPRWTRQEILVLIQGKRVAEGRARRGRGAAGAGGGQVETKWASVSSYCRRHGVNRGPVQCRKRWSNLAGDFKKIREWEATVRGQEAESFWVMRNDRRRERRLPGFFDREVYDVLDRGAEEPTPTLALALAPAAGAGEGADEAEEVIFDSGRGAAAEYGLFSDFEQEEGGGSSPRKVVETEADEVPTPMPLRISSEARGTSNESHPTSSPGSGPAPGEGTKRKRPIAEVGDEDTPHQQSRLVDALERNGKLLREQLELQDKNSRLDRDQKRDQANGVLAVLGKLADALGKIADRL